MSSYAIVSCLDDKTSSDYFKSKKIPRENTYTIHNINELCNRLRTNDIVYAMSINRFISVQQFYLFCKYASSRGVIFKCISTPYLEFGNNKQLKPSIVHHIETLATVELSAIKWIHSYFKFQKWNQSIGDCINRCMIEILEETYSTEGILRRN